MPVELDKFPDVATNSVPGRNASLRSEHPELTHCMNLMSRCLSERISGLFIRRQMVI